MTRAAGQTVRDWTSNSDQRWSRNGNWSGSNRPDANNEIAQFGTGSELNPQLNANNYSVRGLRFSTGAAAYEVGDDNGARTLKIGNGSSGFIENLSASDQLISIATLQFQSAATLSTAGPGRLLLDSTLTGNNRDLTFAAAADIVVSGAITTGSGTLVKQGTADLHLGGANTYTGGTTISGGSVVLDASEVLANAGDVTVAAGGALRLSGYAETIARLGGAGEVDLGAGGSLTLASGTSTFSGTFSGTGSLVLNAGSVLVLGADFASANLNVVLAGGSLQLSGHSITLGALTISANSQIDFGAAADSVLAVSSLGFTSTGVQLSATNWTNAADYFTSQSAYTQGAPPLDQVAFTGWTTADTKWQSYDHQVTPVPEPRQAGAILLAVSLAGVVGRRRMAAHLRHCQARTDEVD